MKNPYIHHKMICKPSDFFGRHQELRRIYSLLEGVQQISVVGDRRIGKSSLLCCLANPDIQNQYKEYDLSHYAFVYIDLLCCAKYTPNEFLKYLLVELLESIRIRFETNIQFHKCTPRIFSRVIDQVNDIGIKVVFLLDEFDYVASNEHFDLDFFNFLRSVAGSKNVSFITASTKSLLDLCHSSVISSPFFNIFSVISLGPLKADEALDLIQIPSMRAGYLLERDTEFILDLAGHHPFLLQVACSLVFEARTQGTGSGLDYGKIRTMFDNQLHDHFQHAWEFLENKRKEDTGQLAISTDMSLHPMLSSSQFRKFVANRYDEDSNPDSSFIGIRLSEQKARVVRIIGGTILIIILVVMVLYLDLLSALQELLLIVLAPAAAWVIREMIKAWKDAQRPQ